MKQHFSDEEIIELGLLCAQTDGVGKLVKSLDVLSWEDACELNPKLGQGAVRSRRRSSAVTAKIPRRPGASTTPTDFWREALLIGGGRRLDALERRLAVRHDNNHDLARLAHDEAGGIAPLTLAVEHGQAVGEARRELAADEIGPLPLADPVGSAGIAAEIISARSIGFSGAGQASGCAPTGGAKATKMKAKTVFNNCIGK